MHAVFIGASKGIGYMTLVRYLASDPTTTATLILRKPDLARQDKQLGPYIAAGRVTIVKGDATDTSVVREALKGNVNFVMTSVGAAPVYTWTGVKIDQPDLCVRAAITLVNALDKKQQAGEKLPRVIAITSMGLGDQHHVLPFAMKGLYSVLLAKPHLDKLAAEYIYHRASSVWATHTKSSAIPPESFIPRAKLDAVRADFVPEITIVRPALFSGDAEPKSGDKVKVGEDISVYTTTRNQVAKFVADECLPPKGQWVNRLPVVGK